MTPSSRGASEPYPRNAGVQHEAVAEAGTGTVPEGEKRDGGWHRPVQQEQQQQQQQKKNKNPLYQLLGAVKEATPAPAPAPSPAPAPAPAPAPTPAPQFSVPQVQAESERPDVGWHRPVQQEQQQQRKAATREAETWSVGLNGDWHRPPQQDHHHQQQQQQQQQSHQKGATKEGATPLMRLHQRSFSVTASSLRVSSAAWRGRKGTNDHAPPPDGAPAPITEAEWTPFPPPDKSPSITSQAQGSPVPPSDGRTANAQAGETVGLEMQAQPQSHQQPQMQPQVQSQSQPQPQLQSQQQPQPAAQSQPQAGDVPLLVLPGTPRLKGADVAVGSPDSPGWAPISKGGARGGGMHTLSAFKGVMTGLGGPKRSQGRAEAAIPAGDEGAKMGGGKKGKSGGEKEGKRESGEEGAATAEAGMAHPARGVLPVGTPEAQNRSASAPASASVSEETQQLGSAAQEAAGGGSGTGSGKKGGLRGALGSMFGPKAPRPPSTASTKPSPGAGWHTLRVPQSHTLPEDTGLDAHKARPHPVPRVATAQVGPTQSLPPVTDSHRKHSSADFDAEDLEAPAGATAGIGAGGLVNSTEDSHAFETHGHDTSTGTGAHGGGEAEGDAEPDADVPVVTVMDGSKAGAWGRTGLAAEILKEASTAHAQRSMFSTFYSSGSHSGRDSEGGSAKGKGFTSSHSNSHSHSNGHSNSQSHSNSHSQKGQSRSPGGSQTGAQQGAVTSHKSPGTSHKAKSPVDGQKRRDGHSPLSERGHRFLASLGAGVGVGPGVDRRNVSDRRDSKEYPLFMQGALQDDEDERDAGALSEHGLYRFLGRGRREERDPELMSYTRKPLAGEGNGESAGREWPGLGLGLGSGMAAREESKRSRGGVLDSEAGVKLGNFHLGRRNKAASGESLEAMLQGVVDKADEDVEVKNFILDPAEIEMGPVLASGASGEVSRGTYRGQDVAVKIFKSTSGARSSKWFVGEFRRELTTLIRCSSCPELLKLYGVFVDSQWRVGLVTKYMEGGTLLKLLSKRKGEPLPLRDQLRIALDVATAMQFLHSQEIIHRDLKSPNILLDKDGHAVVCDFGVSRMKEETGDMTKEVGTYRWMAPEAFGTTRWPVTTRSDVYSFAIVLWEIVTTSVPFQAMTTMQAAIAISLKGLRPSIPDHCHPQLRKLMEQCWVGNPEHRPDFSDIIMVLKRIQATEAHDKSQAS